MVKALSGLVGRGEKLAVSSVADGLEGLVIGTLARERHAEDSPLALAYLARDAGRLAAVRDQLAFFAPEVSVLQLPAWDCLPYDRVSPNVVISAQRMATLARLSHLQKSGQPVILMTTVGTLVQKLAPHDWVMAQSLVLAPGNRLNFDDLTHWLESNGFQRTSTVREPGEHAVRGGIVDLFAPGTEEPVRLDFFGDTLETIRSFDVESQRSTGQMRRLELVPTNEVVLGQQAISRFRQAYVSRFGATTRDDQLYTAVSEGRRYPGLEHWLALFHDHLDPLFAYLHDAPLVLDPLIDDAIRERLDQIHEHYEARCEVAENKNLAGATVYNPVEPEALYLSGNEITLALADRRTIRLTPFATPDDGLAATIDLGGRAGRSFAAERAAGDVNVFDALIAHIGAIRKSGRRAIIACWSEGSRDRFRQVLEDHGLERMALADDWAAVETLDPGVAALVVLGVETGVETDDFAIIGEQDVLGDRLVRSRRKHKKGQDVLTEASSLSVGDVVVHIDHGIGRFFGLKTVTAAGAPHDCLELHYSGDDKLYLPVENIELLTRYGSEDMDVALDKLGGGAWQARKARMKSRVREIAGALIKTAAARALKSAPVIATPEGLADEFAARFPYEETEDQMAAIEAVAEDLASGHPTDRLVCGDVGFGKTEVALRAAFMVAMSGRQVAVVVPTTLLARQHYKTFEERFRGLPVRVEQASRLVGTKDMKRVKAGLADGSVDIVVGTHALLGKAIQFRDLGLLIVDEEQHFGVKHKERLKELKTDVHILTLTATPIPRTLQLALTGVRELSLIGTPPVDRLAVRSFISPFDPLVVREALLRERYRGGQSFYVCPRISDLEDRREFLATTVPEVKVAVAHGQMSPGVLEDIMTAFYEGQYDVLLSTTIVESGLDIPRANTLIVHRADMFGLAQLYQLRGRVGRSKLRAYALFTVPANQRLTPTAEKRLKVLQSLDTLGAGFQLASHDLDIRGAGNLVGEEQSGHIKEVGFELYQQMLEEAVAQLRDGGEAAAEDQWSPQIALGTPVMIPEGYVPDLQLRMSLYRRLADLAEAGDIDAFGAELVDRFGPLPDEVEHLLKIVFIKGLCRKANVEKVDAGPKGIVVAFRNNEFANPAGLVRLITEQGVLAKIRPDQKVVFVRNWPGTEERLKGVATILSKLVRLAREVAPAV